MVLRCVLCFFALLLSVASLCVSAGETGAGAAVGPDTLCIPGSSEPPCPAGGGGGGHPPGTILPAVKQQEVEGTGGDNDLISRPETLAETVNLNSQGNPQGNLKPPGKRENEPQPPLSSLPTQPHVPGSVTELNPTHDGAQIHEQTSQGKASGSLPANDLTTPVEDGQDEESKKNSEEQQPLHSASRTNGNSNDRQSSLPQVQEPSSAGTPESQKEEPNVNSDSSKDENTFNQKGSDSQSSSSTSTEPPGAPSPQETEGTTTSVTVNTDNGTTTSAETTTTTTTTTTLPPELTNNKKGDADSSSSISSSVWVRVPLLIVVTLACILVC
ncbi:uncharacterized protein TM35_000102950 [Trypanosoma theileri]|uniref:Mucin TcMUCII n=1 Tax=Trypanosoma theileri TaxID=67003 RepID=A0A1X0NZA9_9TRYP|nr:uncharacterized protein TM35_000102950 [Trypanosoma theileri]ORC90027.1 hypothetical protein TM35_000102950 [Trypanosoma theileri]